MSAHGANDQDLSALAHLAARLRDETYGANRWDPPGIHAKLAELRGQNLAIVVERVLCHATDPEAKTPGAILRNFTPSKPSQRESTKPRAPKPSEACRVCGDDCVGPCVRDQWRADGDPEPHRERTADAAFDASLARVRGADLVRVAAGWKTPGDGQEAGDE